MIVSVNCQENMQQLTNSDKLVLNSLIQFRNLNSIIFVSQRLLALKIFKCQKTVNRAISKLRTFGFIKTKHRYKRTKNNKVINDTNIYKINQTLLDYAHVFVKHFKNLKFFLVSSYRYIQNNMLYKKALESKKSIHIENVLPSKSNKLYIPYKDTYLSKREARSKKVGQRVGIYNRKRKKMEEIVITDTLKSVTTVLNLTKWGQIKLLPFPDEALKSALDQIKFSKNVKDKFAWFISACKSYCTKNNLQTDWSYYYELKEALNMPNDAPVVLKPKAVSSYKLDSPMEDSESARQKIKLRLQKERQDRMKDNEAIKDKIKFWEQFIPEDKR